MRFEEIITIMSIDKAKSKKAIYQNWMFMIYFKMEDNKWKMCWNFKGFPNIFLE